MITFLLLGVELIREAASDLRVITDFSLKNPLRINWQVKAKSRHVVRLFHTLVA